MISGKVGRQSAGMTTCASGFCICSVNVSIPADVAGQMLKPEPAISSSRDDQWKGGTGVISREIVKLLIAEQHEVTLEALDLQLSGHTHGGQLALPSAGGRLNLARLVTRYHRGLFRENGSVLYVNRGAGVAGPALRVNCPREITTIELV